MYEKENEDLMMWLTTAEAAAYLKISEGHLLNSVSAGKIKYSKLFSENRYLLSDLLDLLTPGPCFQPSLRNKNDK